jgi:hypothetical protein
MAPHLKLAILLLTTFINMNLAMETMEGQEHKQDHCTVSKHTEEIP